MKEEDACVLTLFFALMLPSAPSIIDITALIALSFSPSLALHGTSLIPACKPTTPWSNRDPLNQ